MSVPKKRSSKSRKNRRRQHISLKKPTLTECQKCGKKVLPHTVCPFCGFYKGRVVMDVMENLDKKEKKEREKEIKAKEKGGAPGKGLDWRKLSRK